MASTPEKTVMTEERMRAIILGRRADWIITIAIMVLAIIFIYLLQSLPERATFFPWFITTSIMLIGGIYSYGKWKRKDRWDAQYDPQAEVGAAESDTGPAFIVQYWRGIIKSLGTFFALIFATIILGPEFSVPLFVTASLWFNKESKIVAVLSGIGFWLVIHFVFGDFMSINLPTGYLIDLFG